MQLLFSHVGATYFIAKKIINISPWKSRCNKAVGSQIDGNERVFFSQLTDERKQGLSQYEQFSGNLKVNIYLPRPYSWNREHKATNGVNERGREREPEGDVSLGEQRQREGGGGGPV